MTATSLACFRCGGGGKVRGLSCSYCDGVGRRRPYLAEWDALVAERDRYEKALRQIKNSPWAYPAPKSIARAALDGQP